MRPDPDDGFEVDGGGLALDTESPLPPTGPHDGDELDPELTDAAGLVDFGSLRVPVPPDGTVTVEPTAGGRMQAVHIALPEGRLSVSALAAPKSSKLWPELAGEIDASLREGGARVRSFPGEWGRELHATSGGATSVFVGVDGARWMVYGVATGPSGQAAPLDAELRRLLRGTVVVRGKQPYPVRTILPLTMPDHLAAEAEAAAAAAVTATKKRSSAKAGAGRSAPGRAAPGKTAPGKTAPPNSDTATAAAKKAAARRAAARKAAAAAAVKAAAEALAEQAAEDRAAAAERPDAGTAARGARTGAYPAAGTVPTGPGPDAPLHEQAPSARRAAAAAWRARPAAPPPAEALPVARPVADPPATEALPLAPAARPDLPPTEALPHVEPGSGGRRRLGEPVAAPPPPGGRRHLPEPAVEEPRPGGRRRLREPAADLPPPARGYPADPPLPEGGRRRLREPDGVIAATAPWAVDAPDGRRRSAEPVADTGVSASGRRRLREPGERGAPRPAEPFAPPGPAGADRRAPAAGAGVSATGRRRLRESWEPSEPGVDAGVSATGRRRLRESWDDAGPRRETAPGGPSGSGGRRGPDVAPPVLPGGAAADTGVSASGRRRLREPWDEAPPRDARAGSIRPADTEEPGRRRLREPWEDSGPGVSATGRRRLRESWDGDDAGAGPWETGPGGPHRSSGPPGPLDGGISGAGRRRLRESWDEAGADPGPGVAASGRRRLREPWEGAEQGGAGPVRRRLHDPWDDAGPEPVEPVGQRRHDAGADLLSGTGGRRRLREPEPAPVRDGTQTEPWLHGPGGPPERGARRTPNSEYMIETGEQDAGWVAALDGHGDRRDGGRHSGAGNGSPTVRLESLLSELDPNRPRRRHRR
ncbi:DUF3710 domain-containing protein [Pseudonocardia adelaidensis]|uniref:DUF3710 domain-containing protein n=1 Tax=Pseudonocardia adelaidensis TaxID=648754 RepID=A0ABP9NKZ2_9PSEU